MTQPLTSSSGPAPRRSGTVPLAGQSEADVLDVRADLWRRRPLLREIYRRYFDSMIAQLAVRPGVTSDAPPEVRYGRVVELGGGAGNFRAHFPSVLATDIVPTPHVQLAVDAMQLPFAQGVIDNLVLLDVVHHLPFPLRFFAECQRVLRPGGRVVLIEPYVSLASWVTFKLAHPEPVDTRVPLFAPFRPPKSAAENASRTAAESASDTAADPPAFAADGGAFASNQAIPTLLFFRDEERFRERFPGLIIRKKELQSLIVYPLSGGFSGPRILPQALEPLAWRLEKWLSPLARWLAFRLLVVLEKAE